MGKDTVITIGSVLSTEDISAYFKSNPIEPSFAEQSFPLEEMDNEYYKTISNASNLLNIAADPISLNSPVPVSGRKGYNSVIGQMTSFGKGFKWEAEEIEKYEKLKRDLNQLKNASAAEALLKFYSDDLAKIRTAMRAQMSYIDWAVLSNACTYEFLASNSIYMQGIAPLSYTIEAWQKDAVATSWANPAALILTDIQRIIDTGEAYGKNYLVIKINKKWFNYVRTNTQVKNNTITLVGSLVGATNNPTLEQINQMLGQYFDYDVRFEVIKDQVTREDLDGVQTTSNPFADGVAVFCQGTQVGRFAWKKTPIIDGRESYQDFYTIGNYRNIDPNFSKTYGKGKGFVVVDSYADNFYLKINAEAWS